MTTSVLATHTGDLSYASGFLSRWDSWMEMMQPIAARVPLMVRTYITYINKPIKSTSLQTQSTTTKQTSPGNHERDDVKTSPFYADATTSLWAKNDAGGECGVPYAVGTSTRMFVSMYPLHACFTKPPD